MPTDTETYNGWANYATWGVALVLDNDEDTHYAVREQAEIERTSTKSDGNVVAGIWSEEECARFRLADWIKDYTEELCGLEGEGLSMMARQVLQAGLEEVDWQEIADNVLAA